MKATFSSWILLNGLSGTHNLRVSSLRHEDSCFHHLQTLFVERSLVRQLYLLFFLFSLSRFVFLDVLSLFPYCPISESGCLTFHLLSFLCYLDPVCQLLGSYGGHVLVDSVKRAILRPQTENLQLETQGLLFSSCANVVSGKEHCPTTLFTSFVLSTETFCLFRFIGSFLFCAISESGCLTFNVVSFLDISSVKQFWGPLEATFSSWIRSSGLHCARELRASNLKHKDCCFYQLQTLFVEGNVVRQLCSRFLSF